MAVLQALFCFIVQFLKLREIFLNGFFVMSHIRNLREKIEDNPSKPMYIQTVWGVGYRFNKNLSSGL